MKALKAVGVYRKYGEQGVLKDFALELDEGDFFALMGPSGSGKSTFLHVASGLLSCNAGEIEIAGEKITAMNDNAATRFRRRHIGVVFQAFNLLNEKTVRENILMPLTLESGKKAKDPNCLARMNELVEKLGIAGLLDKRPEQLSGGEQQRVAIARALIVSPAVILADEPTGNLDAKAAKGICELMKGINATEKSAILVVTHDPQVAATAKKVAFLKDGRIAAIHETEGDAEKVSRVYLETFAS